MCAAVVGSLLAGARLNLPSMPLVPRLEISNSSTPLPLAAIDRLQDEQVGGEVDLAVRPPGGVLEVDDRLVVAVGRVERELDRAGELLVGPRVAERLAAGHRRPRGDGDLRDLGERRTRNTSEREREQNPEHEPRSRARTWKRERFTFTVAFISALPSRRSSSPSPSCRPRRGLRPSSRAAVAGRRP